MQILGHLGMYFDAVVVFVSISYFDEKRLKLFLFLDHSTVNWLMSFKKGRQCLDSKTFRMILFISAIIPM